MTGVRRAPGQGRELIRIGQRDRYPLQFDISPELGGAAGAEGAASNVAVPHIRTTPPARSLPRPPAQGLPGSALQGLPSSPMRPRLAPPLAGRP
jgi:hypothetical protein